MTNAELIQTIKAEIERLKGICTAQIKANPGQTFPFVMEMTGYDKLLSFLDTLQEQEVKEQKSQDTVGRVSVEIRSNLQTDEVVRKTLIMLVNDGRISVTGAITSSDILDWLEGKKEQERPEPYNPVYDEAYLNEKITKASKTWKGVDVDKYMNEVRGRESEKPINQEGLEEEITRTYHDGSVADTSDLDHNSYENIAYHFAQWGAENLKK